ncbi:MAG: exo-alpha-sialidase [Capsulimonadaceae bacterium]|nr:exo-alpha-sialidase [Capsulimonadaceae bacterium]
MPIITADTDHISPIGNPAFPDTIRKRLPVERTWLYRPETDWFYSHHPYLAHFNDRYHAIWSSGQIDEDAPGQRIMHATSIDARVWSEPLPLIEAPMGHDTPLILTPGGLFAHAGGLNVYAGEYELAADGFYENGRRRKDNCPRLDVRLRAITTTDGQHWSDPIDQGIRMLANMPPFALRSGRLIMPGHTMFAYSDKPAGIGGWLPAGIYPDAEHGEAVDENPDGLAGRVKWPIVPCEASGYQTDDGVVHMLLRSGTSRLWVTESFDNGGTYSAIRPTRFSDNVSRFQFGRLPDGRFFYLGTPDTTGGARWRLVISLSDDGIAFDRHYVVADERNYTMRAPGLHKGGDYGYPHLLVHNGTLLVIASRQKESVEIYRTSLSAFD